MGALLARAGQLPPAVGWGAVALLVALLLVELLCLHLPLGLTFLFDSHEVLPAVRAHTRLLAGTLSHDDLLVARFADYPPPVYHLLQLVYFIIAGTHRGMVLINLLLAAVISAAVFAAAARRLGPALGLLAVVLTWSFPEMIDLLTRRFGIELALGAVVTVSLHLLLASDSFRRRRHARALGVALGLGALTKLSFGLYVAVPLALALWRAARGSARARRLKNALTSGVIALVVAAPWYALNAATLVSYFRQETIDDPLATAADSFGARAVNLGARLVADAGPAAVAMLVLLLVVVGVAAWRRRGREALAGAAELPVLLAPLATILLASLALRSAQSCKLYIEFAAVGPALAVGLCHLLAALPRGQPRRWLIAAAVAAIAVSAVVNHVAGYRRGERCIARLRAIAAATRGALTRIRADAGEVTGVGVLVRRRATTCVPCPDIYEAYLALQAGWAPERVDTSLLNMVGPVAAQQAPGGPALEYGGERYPLQTLGNALERGDVDYALVWRKGRPPEPIALLRPEARPTRTEGRLVARWEGPAGICKLVAF